MSQVQITSELSHGKNPQLRRLATRPNTEYYSNVKPKLWSKLEQEEHSRPPWNLAEQPEGQYELRRENDKAFRVAKVLYLEYKDRRWPRALKYFQPCVGQFQSPPTIIYPITKTMIFIKHCMNYVITSLIIYIIYIIMLIARF